MRSLFMPEGLFVMQYDPFKWTCLRCSRNKTLYFFCVVNVMYSVCTVMYCYVFFKLVLVWIYTQSNITKQNIRHSTITKKRKVKHFHYWGRLYQRWINRYTVDISIYIQRINFIRSENRVVRNLDSAIQRIKMHYTRQINSKFEDKTMCISRAVTCVPVCYGMST